MISVWRVCFYSRDINALQLVRFSGFGNLFMPALARKELIDFCGSAFHYL